MLALALATYITSEELAGDAGVACGFLITDHGVGSTAFNVSDHGQAFGVADYTDVAILDLLLSTDGMSSEGRLYDPSVTVHTAKNISASDRHSTSLAARLEYRR